MKWKTAENQDVKNNTDGENVRFEPIMFFQSVNFGWHVSTGTTEAHQFLLVLVRREAEVRDSNFEIVIHENVFWF